MESRLVLVVTSLTWPPQSSHIMNVFMNALEIKTANGCINWPPQLKHTDDSDKHAFFRDG